MYELNKLYNADCMQAMEEIPDKYFELDKDYFCKAYERLETVKSQLRLWDLKGSAQENLFLGG